MKPGFLGWHGRWTWRGLPLAGGLFLGACVAAGAASKDLPPPVKMTAGWQLQDAAKVTDPGETISTADYRPAGWHNATVPGTVLTSLVNAGVYPEPLYGENNRGIPDDLCRRTYWYRAPFTVPKTYAGKRIWLTFEGINYIAEVWVNGRPVGTIKGAFTRGIFDVTSLVTIGGANALAVHVRPQPHPGEPHEKTIRTGTGPNGGETGLDGPTFLCTVGWDWIPTIRDRDSGIWQDVVLSATGPVVLENPLVSSEVALPRLDRADLTVQVTVRNVTDRAQAGLLTGATEGASFKQSVSLQPNETRTITFTPETTPSLRLKNPRLWWPNGYGPQNLYRLQLSFAMKGSVSDAEEVTFGVRQITYSLPGSENLALSVNGVPVMAKGGNWGIDEAMKRIPRERLEAAVRMHQFANYTMIRNWVGQSTSAELYKLCDQYGLLLWDEFFEPHPADGPVPRDVELYLANVKDKILRFRNHPCIALWCARNEGDPPPAIGEGIRRLLAELDPVRLYQPSSTSGRGVNSGGPYHWRTPREFYTFGEAFKTEVGSISVPTLEAIRAMMPAQDWDVINDDWAHHDFCAGAQAGDRYPLMLTSRYGPIVSLADFVRKSQLANYECYRAMYEGRFAKMFRPATGVITWMSHPAQPSFVWQLYSHDLEPNASLYATRKACEPVHIMMNQADGRLAIVNHTPRSLTGAKARVAVYGLEGELQYTQTNTAAASPSATTDLGPIRFPDRLPVVHFVKLELRDAKDALLSENFYWREQPGHEDDFTALNRMPTVPLSIEAGRRDTRGRCLVEIILHNPTPSIALLAHVQLRQARSGRRVLPVAYSDNYVSLLPGETRTLTAEAALSHFDGDAPLVAVDGWNVAVRPVPGSGSRTVLVVPNTDAEVRLPAPPPSGKHLNVVTAVNCGGNPVGFFRFGTSALGVFARDHDFKGGNTAAIAGAIDTTVPDAAPAEVYQSERWGACTYSLPVKRGREFTVRLHFAEAKYQPGERKFNVGLNGRRILSDFDIAAAAGQNKALVKDFPGITANNDGRIVLALTRGSADEPKICGIQVIEEE